MTPHSAAPAGTVRQPTQPQTAATASARPGWSAAAVVRAATVRAPGLNVRADPGARQARAVSLKVLPLDHEACVAQARALLDHYEPFAVLAIKKTSPHRHGITGSTGIPYHEILGKPQFLFQAAADRGILMAGIGDGENEVGFGRIPEVVGRIMPARHPTDHLVVAAVLDGVHTA